MSGGWSGGRRGASFSPYVHKIGCYATTLAYARVSFIIYNWHNRLQRICGYVILCCPLPLPCSLHTADHKFPTFSIFGLWFTGKQEATIQRGSWVGDCLRLSFTVSWVRDERFLSRFIQLKKRRTNAASRLFLFLNDDVEEEGISLEISKSQIKAAHSSLWNGVDTY